MNLTKRHTTRRTLLSILLPLIFAIFGQISAHAVTGVGGLAADFNIVNHKTGQPLHLSDYAGHVILLDFWAYWCGPCADSAPKVEANIVKYYANRGGNNAGLPVTVISISTDPSDPNAVNNFINSYGLELPADDTQGVYNRFGNGSIPYFVVINGTSTSTKYQQWEVIFSQAGYNESGIKSKIDSVDRILSSDANLSSLATNTGALNPSFNKATHDYTITVPFATTSIRLTPAVAQKNAKVKVQGVAVTSGTASAAIPLNVGSNTITTVVTAEDGTTTSTYTITATRSLPSNNANLSVLSANIGILSPTFASDTTDYSVDVPNATSSIRLTATLAQANATVKFIGANANSLTSGTASLNVGPNIITITVTAQDGTTTKTYTVTVTRAAPSNNANLSNLILSIGTLEPTFASDTTGYEVFVPVSTTSITLRPIVEEASATVKIRGFTVPSGAASTPIALQTGANVVTVEVTASDTTTHKTYTVTINRASSSGAAVLYGIKPANGTSVLGSAGSSLTVGGLLKSSAGAARVALSVNGGEFGDATLIPPASLKEPVKWNLQITPGNGLNNVIAKALDANDDVLAVVTFGFIYQQFTGTYNGLIEPSADATSAARQAGLVRLTIRNTSGAFTGSLNLGGPSRTRYFSFAGSFDSGGAAVFGPNRTTALEIKRKNLLGADLPPLLLALNLDLNGSTPDQVTGTLTESDIVVSTITLNRRLYTNAKKPVAPMMNVPSAILDPHSDKGAYTAIFQSLDPATQGLAASAYPQGDGWVLVKVKPDGSVLMEGRLADGQPFSYSNYLSKNNELPLYLTLYGGNGAVIGKVHFRNTAGQSDADGLGLRWFKPANTRNTAYRNGWPDGISVDFLGSKFIVPTAKLSPLAGKTLLGIDPPVTATLTLTDGGLTAPLANQLTVNEKNIVTVNDPDTGAPKLKVKLEKKGKFSGSWVNTPDAPPTPFEGVILQKTQNASGYFLSTPASSPLGTPAQGGAVTIGTVVTP